MTIKKKPDSFHFFYSLLFLLLFGWSNGWAQHIEAGIGIGVAGYQGELAAESADGYAQLMRHAAGFFGRYYINDQISLRAGVQFFRLSGDDAISNRARNLSFRSDNTEIGINIEINIPGFQPYALLKPFSPYLFAGIANVNFNPKAFYNDDWIALQPLGTEGQHTGIFPDKEPYKTSTLAIPVGAGLKYALNDKWNLGIQAGLRFTRTDYLDDVSTTYVSDSELTSETNPLVSILANRSGEPVITGQERGNPDDFDRYFIAEVTVSYNFLDNGLVGSRNRSRRRGGCYN